jgi:hypothetical protein
MAREIASETKARIVGVRDAEGNAQAAENSFVLGVFGSKNVVQFAF